MNRWTSLSIQLANQQNYLDQLFKVYPVIHESVREIDDSKWQLVNRAFTRKNNKELLLALLGMPLFPIKDSYVAYFKRDKTAIDRNPETVARLCGAIYELGIDEVYERCTEPKESNRQIGPKFREWLNERTLGLPLLDYSTFSSSTENAILDAGDSQLMAFARSKLNYKNSKGLDFVARMSGTYIVGEAKFLTDFGGHQNAQFEDAKNLLHEPNVKAIKIGILGGVLYINKGSNKMYRYLTEDHGHNIFSAVFLRDFLFHI